MSNKKLSTFKEVCDYIVNFSLSVVSLIVVVFFPPEGPTVIDQIKNVAYFVKNNIRLIYFKIITNLKPKYINISSPLNVAESISNETQKLMEDRKIARALLKKALKDGQDRSLLILIFIGFAHTFIFK
jgi:hypothetical protein